MITTPMGTERHYTQAYGDFHGRLEADASFRRWFTQVWGLSVHGCSAACLLALPTQDACWRAQPCRLPHSACTQMEAEVADLSSGQPWAGQPPFPLKCARHLCLITRV